MASTTPSCWDILGLGSHGHVTERITQKAYRNKARETHPDRFCNADNKEQATKKFRLVYEAYETAMAELRNGSPKRDNKGSSSFGKDDVPFNKETTSTFLEQVFDAVCKDLDEKSERKLEKKIRATARSIEEAWPTNKDKAWHVFQQSRILLSYFERHIHRDLYNFLLTKRNQRSENNVSELGLRHSQLLDHVMTNWDTNRLQLVQELRNDWTAMDLRAVSKIAADPIIAKTLQACHEERLRNFNERKHKVLEQIAYEIKAAFPDVRAIRNHVEKVTYRSDRKEVLEYLPREMRLLTAGLMFSQHPGQRLVEP